MGRGFAKHSLACSFPQVKLEQVKPMSYVKENVSERMIMDNPSSKRSPSVSFFPFQRISGQCSFQHLSWNNLRWADELDTKVAGDVWGKVESSGRATMDIKVGTTPDNEIIEMDVMCHTRG